MSKEKLVGMICKKRLQTLEENHPFFGIKKVLTPYSFFNQNKDEYNIRNNN